MASTSYQTDGKQEEEEVTGGLLNTDDTGESQPLRTSDMSAPHVQIKSAGLSSSTVTAPQSLLNEKTAMMPDMRGEQKKWFNIYLAALPLAFIFLFDILPSRVSLIFIGHLLNTSKQTAEDSLYDFDAMFAAYGFTNFFVVFILSLSCGLDTLSKQQLRNIEYFRHASILVALGVVPYILACIYARDILYYLLSQPSFIIEKAHNAIQFLIGYCLCYVIFAMLRKSLLQYLNARLLVGIMFVRLCLHIMIGYFLFEYNQSDLGMYCFAISDSISMVILLVITIITLAKFVDFKDFIKALLCMNERHGYKQVMDPSMAPNDYFRPSQTSQTSQIHSHGTNTTTTTTSAALVGDGAEANETNEANELNPSQTRATGTTGSYGTRSAGPAGPAGPVEAANGAEAHSMQLFREYLGAMIIPGAISCLEWWAVEAITWLVGGMGAILAAQHGEGRIYVVYFVHAVYSSLLLIVQMPMLGLSVAMATIITGDIRLGRFNAAYETFVQGLVSALVYCGVVAAVVLLAYDRGLIALFFDLPDAPELEGMMGRSAYNGEYVKFVQDIYETARSVNVLLVVAVACYSVAMCFLGLFVSVGRLAKGGTFMLIGYYVFGLFVSAMCGYVLQWELMGVWVGYACGFAMWCLLSASYWILCTKWKNEMRSMKAAYDDIERYEKGTKMFKQKLKKNYGSINAQ